MSKGYRIQYQTTGTLLVRPSSSGYPVWLKRIAPEDRRQTPTGIVILNPDKYSKIGPVGRELVAYRRQIRMF